MLKLGMVSGETKVCTVGIDADATSGKKKQYFRASDETTHDTKVDGSIEVASSGCVSAPLHP